MQEVFSKIIEELEENQTIVFNLGGGKPKQSIDLERTIVIVKQEAEQYNNGHFGCNTNGEHEKCNGCGLTDCKNRNKIWFGVSDDNNGWIPCSERLPEYGEVVMCSCTNNGITISCITHKGVKPSKSVRFGQHSVIAWQPLPQPYTKGE